MRKLLLAIVLLFAGGTFPLFAQQGRPEAQKVRVLLIFDFSNSMYGLWESDSKINIAKRLVSSMVDSLSRQASVELALRCYGHQKKYPPQDCDDTKLEVPFGKDNAWLIKQKLNKLNPSGTTPIARSLEACAADFPDKNARNIVILITDGKEECDGDPCAISAALQSKGIILRPFIVGVGKLETDIKNSFNCIGNFYDASTELSFRQVIQIVITQVLNATTSQVNLLDQSGKPTETDVAMTFYDQAGGQQRYNFIHTMNHKGVPDTLRLDHLNTYRLVVHTIPPVEKKDIQLYAGKHNIIALDAPQGYLKLQGGNAEASSLRDIPCIIRKAGETNTLHVQTFRELSKLICGSYDLEILCLPRVIVKGVKINQSHTTTVKIEEPGAVSFILGAAGVTSVFAEEGKQLTWVCNLSETATQDMVRLQPGRYKAVYRAKGARETMFSLEKSFQVLPGTSQQVIMK
ncbi:MAG: VWA domain-containing protein [Bacteroidia bacterium]|nr:VWA domain-containing protein [Bacteroidia bacterium]MCC6767485.1 VWA domain-containing protein [Bacteroidia bacterium]